MPRTSSLAALAALLLLGSAHAQSGPARESLTVTSERGVNEFQVEIADDPRERSTGLMYRRSMAKGEGMLFDFGEEQPVGFWMANTYIPLDMIFVAEDGVVRSIAKRTTPLSRTSVPSRVPVRFVLEINGGLSEALGIKPGDKLSGPAIEARPD